MTPKKDIYCNSCKYCNDSTLKSCEMYSQISQSILEGDLCMEYICHMDKELSQELADKLDNAILSRFDFSMEEAIAMARSLKHSRCKGCINDIGFSTCNVFGEKPEHYASTFSNASCPHKILSLECRIKGALYGFAIGDAMGATTEFMHKDEIKNTYGLIKDILGGGWLHLKAGEVTDDTQMTLCVCNALEDTIDTTNPNNIDYSNLFNKCCHYFTEWYHSKPADIGNCCKHIISTCQKHDYKIWLQKAKNPNSLGNGSIMRSMPMVLANLPLDIVLTQGRLTHNNQICDDCIEEYYLMLNQCICGEFEKTSLGYKLNTPTGHVQNTLNNALFFLSEADTAEEAIIAAVNHGGDADTIAAITGSLVGAYYGFYELPTRWIYDLNDDTKQLLDHYTEFFVNIRSNNVKPIGKDNNNVDTFKEKVIKLQQDILAKKTLIHNEENTKQALINPLLSVLGYDIHNPNEVEYEFNASFSYKNSDKVDYAIKFSHKPIIFLEAKKITEELTKHYSQLEYYLSTNSDVEIGILTNGIVYQFFAYFEKQKTMDKEPFFEFDFENLEDEKIDTLSLFCKKNFDLHKLLKKGEELWYYRKITKKLKELLTKPSDDFIRLLAKDYSPTKITASALEKFRPIVNKSITTAITDLTQESIVEAEMEISAKTIITTKDELKAYELTRKMLINANKNISNVDYKDTVSYFAIYNRNINGWFVRFVLDQQPTLAMIRLEYTIAKQIPTDLKLQPLTSKGITKVFINSINDIHKLEPFIIRAYEEVE